MGDINSLTQRGVYNARTMHQSLIERFMRAFWKGIWGEIEDRLVEAFVLAAGIVLILIQSSLSWSKLVESRWEAVATGVWAVVLPSNLDSQGLRV